MRQIFLDTETTGLSAVEGDRLVEVGGIAYDGRRPIVGDEFHSYINPERPMPEEAQKIHGLNDAFLADKQKFADIAERLCNFLSAAEVIIHNAKFDLGFLNAELNRIGRPPINEVVENVICSLNLSRRINIGLRRHSLDVLCAHFGVDAASRQEGHGAMIDARLLGKVYIAMTRGQVAMSIPTGAASVAMEAGGDVPVRLATQSEKAAHEKTLDMMEEINNEKPLWRR